MDAQYHSQYVRTPVDMTALEFATFSADANRGRIVRTPGGLYMSLPDPATGVYFWASSTPEDDIVLNQRGSTVGNLPIYLCPYLIPPGSSCTIISTVTGIRDDGSELSSWYLFGAFREAGGGVVTVRSSNLVGALASDDVTCVAQLIFVGVLTIVQTSVMGPVGKNYNWRCTSRVQLMP